MKGMGEAELTPAQQIIKKLKDQRKILKRIAREEFIEALCSLLEGCGVVRTASILDIGRTTLYGWYKKFNIHVEYVPRRPPIETGLKP
jgi:transcriptional regulator of acetoin/glycerol metabolism